MANTKKNILDALVTGLGGITGVKLATRDLLPPADARANSPYIGVLSGPEDNLAEDATHILYNLQIDIIVLRDGDLIEDLLDLIKNYIYSAPDLGQKMMKLVAQEPVNLVKADKYSSARMVLNLVYSSAKAGF